MGTVAPAREEFLDLASEHRVIPVTMTVLADGHTPSAFTGRWRPTAEAGTFLMESAAPGAAWDRYSFIGARSAAVLTEKDGAAHWLGTPPAGTPSQGNSADVLRDTLRFLAGDSGRARTAALPHLSSGLVGYIGWDVVRHWERLPHPPAEGLGLPEMAMNLVSDLAVHDNRSGTVTLIANAINVDGRSEGAERAYEDAADRLRRMRDDLSRPVAPELTAAEPDWSAAVEAELHSRVRHTWDESEYMDCLRRAKQAIVDGEVFQIVVSRRFEVDTSVDALSIYRMLRLLNPSPYMYLMSFETPDGEPYQVVGASPEALVTVEDRIAVSHRLLRHTAARGHSGRGQGAGRGPAGR